MFHGYAPATRACAASDATWFRRSARTVSTGHGAVRTAARPRFAGHKGAAFPGVLISAAIFGVCLGLYRLVVRLDKLPEGTPESHGAGPWQIG